ncbi:MAG: thiamine diphosphokinase [Thermoanaerobaculaceae bacterium]
MEAVVVANAPFRFWPEAFSLVRRAPLLLAADGGANHLAALGVRPHFVVGDFDSLEPSVRAWVGEARLVSRPDQDHTDLEKTLEFALEQGARSITVLAATGGRLDHALENLAILGRFADRAACEIWDREQRILPVSKEALFQVKKGATVSLMPLGKALRVWTQGLHWPLHGEPLDLLSRTGLSNRAVASEILVKVEGGVLLVFLPW